MQYTSRVDDWDPWPRRTLLKKPEKTLPPLHPSSAPNEIPPPLPTKQTVVPINPVPMNSTVTPWGVWSWTPHNILILAAAFVFVMMFVWLYMQNRAIKRLSNTIMLLDRNLYFMLQRARPY